MDAACTPVSAAGLADLHRHLDGSLRRSTLEELARRAGKTVPADLLFRPRIGLEAALSRFRFTLSLLQELSALRRVAAEACEDAALDGVTTLELRFAPQLHGALGASLGEVIDAALDGIAGRAGLLLCGLYGEPPRVLHELVAAAASRPGVVGIDLAGGPAPSHAWGLGAYAAAFRAAAELGLGRTAHVGEGRSAHEVRAAIELLGVQRVGHATTLLDDEATLQLLLQRQVTVEACPTSNVHTGVIAEVAAHPVAAWLARGVRVCVCTDNTLLSDVCASQELARVRQVPGIDDAAIASLTRMGHEAAFRRREGTAQHG